ncbi:hypothetical protein [Haloarchaeobius sp. DFWS5]|uniref:hypothetical protein n=1 Tax=Haloarchaeobius sp. DFWS5 TaxID=3446114 RepID=UPI003EC0A664
MAIIVFLAGCTTVPFTGQTDQEQSVQIRVGNNGETTQTFEVHTVEPGTNFTINYPGDRVGNHTIGEGSRQINSGDGSYFESVEVPDSARNHGQYTLQPGQGTERNITEFSSPFAVIIVVYQSEKEVLAVVSVNCGDASLTGLEVKSDENSGNGVNVAHSCE